MNALKAFLVAACKPEIEEINIYRGFPAASPEAKGKPSITMIPIQGGQPVDTSRAGESSVEKQIQVVQVAIKVAAVGQWSINLLGETASYNAILGDTTTDIRNGLQAAVDALALDVTTSVVTLKTIPVLVITSNVAGVSMLVNMLQPGDIPAGGQAQITVVDDSLRRCVQNWGQWTVRLLFRSPTPTMGGLPGTDYNVASRLAGRVKYWLMASPTLPVVNGSAYPYWHDQLFKVPSRLAWRQCMGPFEANEVEGNTWIRGVALDVEFDVPTGLIFDIPSIDSLGPGTLQLSP